jgi:hypothetical protein
MMPVLVDRDAGDGTTGRYVQELYGLEEMEWSTPPNASTANNLQEYARWQALTDYSVQ